MTGKQITRVTLTTLVLAVCLAAIASRPTSAATGKVMSIRIYLVNINGKGLGCGGGLVAVRRHIKPTAAPLTAALRLLLAVRRVCGRPGLCSALARSRLRIQRVTVVRGKATVHLTGTLLLGGVCDDPRVRGQIRATAFQFPTVHAVTIFVNNVPLSRLLSQR